MFTPEMMMPFEIAVFPKPLSPCEIKPFTSAEGAWLWASACLAARRAGKPVAADKTRPCSPETILRCLDRLYRSGRIDLVHARVLRVWGDRGRAPKPHSARSHGDWPQWRHALSELECLLRPIGVVRGFDLGLPAARENFLPNDRITFLFPTETTPTKEI